MDINQMLTSMQLVQDEIVMKTNADKDQMSMLISEFNSMRSVLKQHLEEESSINVQGVVSDSMDFFDWLNAPSYAETTHLHWYDPQFQWKKGYTTAWTGYSGEGKSTQTIRYAECSIIVSSTLQSLKRNG